MNQPPASNERCGETNARAAHKKHRLGLLSTAVLAGLAGYLVASPQARTNSAMTAEPPRTQTQTPFELTASRAADSSLSPIEVVKEQMKALSACRANRAAPARVFSLASPANKAVTGPLERFEKMLWAPPFDALILNEGWSVGRAVERDGVAAVLVLTVQPGGGTLGFRFYLSRQEGEEAGRWMTDAVLPQKKMGEDWVAALGPVAAKHH